MVSLKGWLVKKTTVIDAIDSFNNPAAFIILEISPLAGSTGVKLEGAAMLEADSGVMLGGRTELGGTRLI